MAADYNGRAAGQGPQTKMFSAAGDALLSNRPVEPEVTAGRFRGAALYLSAHDNKITGSVRRLPRSRYAAPR